MAFKQTTPAPHQNNVPAGYEYLLSSESKAILEEFGLTVDIAPQQDPHKLRLPIPFVGVEALIPNFPNHTSIRADEVGATDQETIDNVLNNAKAKLKDNDEPITNHWAVYLYEKDGRKFYTADAGLAEAQEGKLAGVAYATESQSKKLGVTAEAAAKFVDCQFIHATMFVNNELLQIIWRREGEPLDIDDIVMFDVNYINRRIKNKTRNIALRRPTEAMDFSQFV